MAKDDAQAPEGDEENKEGAESEAPKQGLVKKLLGNKLILFGGAGAILLLLLGGGAYFFFFSASPAPEANVAGGEVLPPTPPSVAFYDVPDIIVNIQGADSAPAYLKLSVSLELYSAEEKPGLQALMPRVVDQFQGYLRELRMDDLKGSAGVVRLKEELLRRVNVSAAPYRVRDVLLKQVIVQ
ncbi:MAG TPA: flagellar basal body-associated FliL family protein [Rhizomicrobium sp.]|nr:flagellar basal body-associated FliL family protein [Rhizomicrobium sp.]